MSDVTESPKAGKRRRLPSLFWPILLIGAGVVMLLSNLGYLPWSSWNILWRLWPLLLVAVGVDLLIGRRSTLGAILSGLLILLLVGGAIAVALYAPAIPTLANLAQPAAWRVEHVEHPLDGIDSAAVTIDWTSVPGSLQALDDSPNLIEGDIALTGDLVFDVGVRQGQATVLLDRRIGNTWNWPFGDHPGPEGTWDVTLSPRVPLALNLDTGSGDYAFDLSDLQITDVVLDSGSGVVELALPGGDAYEVRIDGGSGSVEISLPEDADVRVEIDSGSGSFRPTKRLRLVKGERGGDGVWETEGFASADDAITVILDQGSGSVTLVER